MGRPMYAQCLEVQIRVRSADKGLSKLFEHGKNCTFRVFFFKLTVFLSTLLLANGSVFEHTCVNSVKIRAAAAAKVMGVE